MNRPNITTQALLDSIDQAQNAMLDQLVLLANMNSGTCHLEGLAQVHDALYTAFEPLADSAESICLPSRYKVSDTGEQQAIHYGKALRFRKRPTAAYQVLLCGHMDTVFPAHHAFQRCAFIEGNRLHGPGTADMKGGLLVMLQALRAWEQHPLADKLGWEVIINPDEETGSLASATLLQDAAQGHHLGLVYEPALADGTLAGSRKGSGNFSLLIKGRAAHAGREFEQGRNAIAALARAMEQLSALNHQRSSITLNLGRISGGQALNVVADTAVCHFNVRTESLADQAWMEAALQNLLAAINRHEGFEDGISAALHGTFNRPPKKLSPANEQLFEWLKSCGETLGVSVHYKPTGGCCDGNNLAAAGLPNIDTLGVRGGNIHTADEFMCIDSLSERAKLSVLLLEKLATSGADYQALLNTERHIQAST